MEKIILFLIVFGVGSLYEYLKESRKKRAESPRAADQSPETAPGAGNPFAQLFRSLESPAPAAAPRRQQRQRQASARSAATAQQPVAVRPTAAQKAQEAGQHPSSSAFLPGELHASPSEMQSMPEIQLEDLDEIAAAPAAVSPATDSGATARHYARWRQAIIDSEIITPKFSRQEL